MLSGSLYVNSLLDKLEISNGGISGGWANLFGQQWGREAGDGLWAGGRAVVPWRFIYLLENID